MAGTILCEPSELYNLLNQQHNRLSRLAEFNYLCLIGKNQSEMPVLKNHTTRATSSLQEMHTGIQTVHLQCLKEWRWRACAILWSMTETAVLCQVQVKLLNVQRP